MDTGNFIDDPIYQHHWMNKFIIVINICIKPIICDVNYALYPKLSGV